MIGIAARALIRDWEVTHDSRLIPTLRRLADWLWVTAWDPVTDSMLYQINPGNSTEGGRSHGGTPDLNLLVAPIYAFLWSRTGETKYRDQGDALFAGGVTGAYLGSAKHFNQNYVWSFDYVKWRGGAPSSTPVPYNGGTAPRVTFVAPLNGSNVQGTVTVSASASGSVSGVRLYLDGRMMTAAARPSASYVWNTTTAPNGAHSWRAVAYDSAGRTLASSTISTTVRNTSTGGSTGGFTASFDSPDAGARVSGNLSVGMKTSAPWGASKRWTLAIDGTSVLTVTNTATVLWRTLDTRRFSIGSHTLRLTVTYNGTSVSTTRTVTIAR